MTYWFTIAQNTDGRLWFVCNDDGSFAVHKSKREARRIDSRSALHYAMSPLEYRVAELTTEALEAGMGTPYQFGLIPLSTRHVNTVEHGATTENQEWMRSVWDGAIKMLEG